MQTADFYMARWSKVVRRGYGERPDQVSEFQRWRWITTLMQETLYTTIKVGGTDDEWQVKQITHANSAHPSIGAAHQPTQIIAEKDDEQAQTSHDTCLFLRYPK